jgi:glucosamine-6-phosphate deaminase
VKIRVFENKILLAQAAAADAAKLIRDSIREQGKARIIAATGASQFDFLGELTKAAGIDWRQVEMFHLDEYLGLPMTHPASFRKYLLERLIRKTGITQYHLLDGERDPVEVIAEVDGEIGKAPIDVAFVGVGENGHLAFNDPPADFETDHSYIVVELDEACRRQQLGEGWFKTLAEVPERAISMTVKQILKARQIICIVPDSRKAGAVATCFGGEISPAAPASILRSHPNTTVYLDKDSASRLRPQEAAPPGLRVS